MSTSAEELRQRIRQRLAGATKTIEAISPETNGTESKKRKPVNECGRCGESFSRKSRHLIHIYHQRKGKAWEVIAQERIYLCPGCLLSVQAFIDGEW